MSSNLPRRRFDIMEPCVMFKPSITYDEPIESYDEWPPISYNIWPPGDVNNVSYSSNDNSSPSAYSRSNFPFSYDFFGNISNTTRPLSDIASKSSSWSQELVTPPVTPQQCRGWPSSMSTHMASKDPMGMSFHSDDFVDDHLMLDNNQYLPEILQLSLGGQGVVKKPIRSIKRSMSDTRGIVTSFGSDVSDLALTHQVFVEPPQTPIWQAPHVLHGPYATPKTIAPKATFQTPFHSSPVASVDRLSPTVTPTCTDFEYSLDSSPLPVPSRAVVPSQNSFTMFNSQRKKLAEGKSSLAGPVPSRVSQRPHLRKSLRSMADRPRKEHDDRVCNEVIPANAFICTVPGCLDKARGKPKSFKRQEHRKRHEKTVHGINGEIFKIPCWAPQCPRSFTRTDNLKSHFKTHGKNSSTSRNRYVATLDESSPFYDPHWRGELTEDGFPVIAEARIHQCWVQECGKKYHLQSKLKTHLLQQHGRKSSNPTALYVATLDENSDHFDPEWRGKVMDDGSPIR